VKTPPRILATRLAARSRLFRIEQVDLRFANGVEVEYERLRGSDTGAVLIVPVTAGAEVLLVREYCVGTERYELGFAKGRIEPGETPEQAAERELKEETGFGARRLERLMTVSLAPGYFGHLTHVLLARDLYPQRLAGDEPEPVEVVSWPLARARDLVQREDFTEARSLLALYLALDRLDGGHAANSR